MDSAKDKMFHDLLKCLCGMSLHRIPATDKGVLGLRHESLLDVIQPMSYTSNFLLIFRSMEPRRVYEIRTYPGIYYLAMRDEANDHHVVVGACRTEPFSEVECHSILTRMGVSKGDMKDIEELFRRMPVVPSGTLHQLGTLLAHHLLGLEPPVPYQYLEEQWATSNRRDILFVDHFDELFRMRLTEQRYELSKAMTEAVKQGNLSLAYQFFQTLEQEGGFITRNSNPLRNAQNMCIVMNTQLRYAMEETGLHPYQLDRFSHNIAVQIEKLSRVEDVRRFSMEIVRQYCELAQEKTYANLKPFSRLVVTYIKAHLSDSLTVKEAAQALTVNANYLSYQFHKDVGLTFTEFVNRERVKQAATLLRNTNLQIQQIAAAVGYNNTSYFAKQFAKHHQLTPRDYRFGGGSHDEK